MDKNSELVGVGFAWREMDYSLKKPEEVLCSVYIPVGHITEQRQLPVYLVKQAMQEIADACHILVYNAGYEIKEWLKYGVKIKKFHDVRYDALAYNEKNTRKGLKANAEEYLSMKWGTVEAICTRRIKTPNEKGKLTWRNVFDVPGSPIQTLGDYCRKDCEATYLLWEWFKPKVKAMETIIKLERSVTPVVVQMESRGIRIDLDALDRRIEKSEKLLEEYRSNIYQLAGKVVNLNSPKQLSALLFDELGLRQVNERSTDVTVLQELKNEHPICEAILTYRGEEKIRGTYLIPLKEKSIFGRIYTSLNQWGAKTGRFSSSGPNMQNIPADLEIRGLFVPTEGMVFGDYDYSQIEGRGFAHLTGDPVLVEYYRQGGDIHTATANEMGIERRLAKTCNFAIIYGCYPKKLAEVMQNEGYDYDTRQAKDFIRNFWDVYKVGKQKVDQVKKMAYDLGYVETAFGRRQRFPDIRICDDFQRYTAEREAVSHWVQGTCGDVMKYAIADVGKALYMAGDLAYPLLQVHDELLFEGYEHNSSEWDRIIKHRMSDAVVFQVPIVVEGRIGKNWAEVH